MTIDEILVAYKIGKITLSEAKLLIIKNYNLNKKQRINEKTRKEILFWIFDNHEHHKDDYSKESKIKINKCFDSEFPYVNSIELEKFIKKL